jgi:hypothetical protein
LETFVTLWEELLKILEEAEDLFGPRDRSYEILEPEIFAGSHAQGYYVEQKKIKLYLSNACANEYRYASYELAHEAIHMLSPVFYGQATVLEEGLATYFSHRYVYLLYGWEIEKSPDPKYDAAMRAASALLARNEFLIKEIRTRQPIISKITASTLVEEADIDPRLARFLASDFETYGQKPLSWTEVLARDVDIAFRCLLVTLGLDGSK